jgi:hypothetical protein
MKINNGAQSNFKPNPCNNMNKIILFFTIILLSFFISFEAIAQNEPVYVVKKTSSTINIDGILDEEDWVKADTTSHFVILGTNPTSPLTTTWAKILWDNANLYVGMYCQDKNIWAKITLHDGPLYTEDAVEVYFDPDQDGLNYIEFELNPLNTIFDLWLSKPYASGGQAHAEWNFVNVATAVKINGTNADTTDVDSSWTCEMKFPFSEMQFCAPDMNFPPVNNDIWRANLYRFDRGTPYVSAHEETGWSQTGGGQHVPFKFGALWFKNTKVDAIQTDNISSFDRVVLFQNFPNPFRTSTSVNYYIPQACTVTLRIVDMSGRTILSNTIKHINGGNYSFTIDANSLAPGMYNYTLQTGINITRVKKMIVLQ